MVLKKFNKQLTLELKWIKMKHVLCIIKQVLPYFMLTEMEVPSHNFAVVIPPGAVSQDDCVQIQTAADCYGPFQLPNQCYPISSFFWINAHYKFKVPVYLILSHFASDLSLEDDNTLCAAEVCDDISKERVVMKNVSGDAYFDADIGYCIVATNHFCSFCLLSNRKGMDQNFIVLYYTYDITSPHKAHVNC